jgi:catechol 2,3-dioxygenase
VATHGNAMSIYFRDPEGNRLEVFMDTPWYCEQPLREPIDLDRARRRGDGPGRGHGPQPAALPAACQWQADMARLMGYSDDGRPARR